MTNTDITPYAASPLSERMEYARVLSSAADLIPRALFGPPIDGKPPQPSPGKVLLVLETGAMLNLHPIAALQGINVIEGKPAASAALISAVIRNAGHTLRVSATGTVEGGDYAATATLIRHDDPDNPFTATWTPQRASRAGLCTYTQKDGQWAVSARSKQGQALPWEAYTESLCKARAVTEAARDGAQDALYGVRYTPEELGAQVDERGELIDAPAEGDAPDETPEPSALPAPRKRATVGTQGTKRAPAKTKAADEGPAAVLVVEEAKPKPEPKPEPLPDPKAIKAEQAAGEAAATEAAKVPEQMALLQAKRAADEEAAKAKLDEAAAALDAQGFTDTVTGTVYATQRELDAAIRARIDAKAAERERERQEAEDAAAAAQQQAAPLATAEPSTFDLVMTEDPGNWDRALQAVTTVEEARALYDAVQAAGAMTSALRMEIIKTKARIESAATPADEPSDG